MRPPGGGASFERHMTSPDVPYQFEYSAVVGDARHAREISPAEAQRVLTECLALTRKILGGAFWHAFEELEDPASWRAPSAAALPKTWSDPELAAAVNQRRRAFLPHFTEVYEAGFRKQVGGGGRARRGDAAATLALVEQRELNEQVALKAAIKEMHDAIFEEKFILDLRVRALLHIPADYGAFENPWGVLPICDALGATCRALWRDKDQWRRVMQCCIRVASPHVLNLHRELNACLQDHDVLPLLRVRTRGRGGALSVQRARREGLFDTLSRLLVSSRRIRDPAAAAATAPGSAVEIATELADAELAVTTATPAPVVLAPAVSTPAAADSDSAALPESPAVGAVQWTLAAPSFRGLIAALTNLQRAHVASTPVTAAAVRVAGAAPSDAGMQSAADGASTLAPAAGPDSSAAGVRPGPPVNEIRLAEPQLIKYVDSAINQVIVYVVAGLMDYVFDDPYLVDEGKAVFGRLQITLLKAALLDPAVMSDPANPTRRFFDTLANAMVGLEPDDPQSRAMLALANRLAGKINQEFDVDLGVFEVAHRELEAHLEIEWVRLTQRVAEATPELLAQDARIEAREDVRGTLAARMSGSRVPMAVHSFLTTEWLDHLTDIYVEHGQDSPQWKAQLALIDDLLWSLGPDAARHHKKLGLIVPKLVHAFSGGQAVQKVTEPRRRAMLDGMFALYVDAFRPVRDHVFASDQPHVPISPSIAPPPDAIDDQVVALARGDWCEFRGADGADPVLARLAWRSPHRMQLLFTHRNGATARVHTPASLAEEFRSGRARVALEDIPLFERGMLHLIEHLPDLGES
jgi:hypothetical protein